MRARTRLSGAVFASGCLAIVLGCLSPRASEGSNPSALATRLFEVARENDAASRRVGDLFVKPPTGAAAAGLHDVLDELGRVEAPRVVGIAAIDGEDRVAVDVEGTPADGGTARYSLHLTRQGDAWKIDWIGGPALAWPTRPADARGPGLSSSGGETGGSPR